MILPVAPLPYRPHLPEVQQPGSGHPAAHGQWRDQPQAGETNLSSASHDSSTLDRWRPERHGIAAEPSAGVRANGERHLVLPAARSAATAATGSRARLLSTAMRKVAHAGMTAADGSALAGFHWRSAPPELLLALQEGGRARMLTLARYAR